VVRADFEIPGLTSGKKREIMIIQGRDLKADRWSNGFLLGFLVRQFTNQHPLTELVVEHD
jgi:hypothetical protein